MSSLNARFKNLGLGFRRKSSAQVIDSSLSTSASTVTLPTATSSNNNTPTSLTHPPSASTSSTPSISAPAQFLPALQSAPVASSSNPSLAPIAGRPVGSPTAPAFSSANVPMNPGQQHPPGYGNAYNPAIAGRTQSPMNSNPRTPPIMPPPINTGGGYPPPAGGPPHYGGPPGYGSPPPPANNMMPGQYQAQRQLSEVEGAGRSKAQLIVGIDFVRAIEPIDRSKLIEVGNNLFRRRVCVCDKLGSQGGHHH